MHPDDDTPIYHELSEAHARRNFAADPLAQDLPDRPPAADAPGDDHDAGAAAHLDTVTDFEWFEAHNRLMSDVPDLAPELDYIWAPELPAREVAAQLGPVVRDMAPTDGRYDPNADERFHGGGFRG